MSAWELVLTCVTYLAFSILAAYAVAYLCYLRSRRRHRRARLARFNEIRERVQSELETDRQAILREVRGERP